MEIKCKTCELCNQQASLYCPSDSAFLCRNCDDAVHAANLLVARHHRQLICSKCNGFTGIHISGTELRRLPSTCQSCLPENPADDTDSQLSSSPSESCTTAPKKMKSRRIKRSLSSVTDETSPAKKMKIGSKSVGSVAEEIFVKWRRELELDLPVNGNRVVVEALNVCLRKWKLLPLEVVAATSFWFGLRFCGDVSFATSRNLIRLEKISKVPAKLILAAHAKLARVLTHHFELQEGWDES
ncbi:B-box zinc finger protein 32 [Cicer arietinum]|uniref:B-box zinc finger protein 32 n=1 Tax=Cicer arietinum TaxID=3827 RepID=A0A1S2YMK3_CICAR|nr:B-box zinc finger protein 32 [Cicer arietinum]